MNISTQELFLVKIITESIYSAPSVEGRKKNLVSPLFPAKDVFPTASRLRVNCFLRQVTWVSVLKGCEFLDHQSYLHSDISIQTHLSPNIEQPFYDAGVGRQDLYRLMDTSDIVS
jgi:hypothetical protein